MNNKVILSILTLCITIFSCSSDDNSVNNDTSCAPPTNFEVVAYNFLSEVELSWTAGSTETEWEIEYGTVGFTQGNGDFVLTSTTIAEISGLNFNVAYDFYIRSICDAENASNWVGPISNVTDTNPSSEALMTANINGVQYNNLVPFFWPTTNAVNIQTFTTSNENYIHIQGNSAPTDTQFSNTKEINLFIPESQWAVGTYVLGNDSIDANQVPTSNVNIVYFDSTDAPSQASEYDNGTITITEFNLTDRIIRGTFEFSFDLNYTQTTDVVGPLECLNGTFDYTLDASFFD